MVDLKVCKSSTNQNRKFVTENLMTDSFLKDHQPGIDHMHEENAINDLKNTGIYPEIEEPEINEDDEDYEPTDQEMMSSFGTKWHDGL